MTHGRSLGDKVFDVFNVAAVGAVMLVSLYPIYFTIVCSISDGIRLMSHRGILLAPLGLSFSSYRKIFENQYIVSSYANTVFIIVVGTSINLFLTSLGAFFLSRKNILFQKPIFLFFLFTMFFSGGMIPSFLNIRNLGLYDSLWALILPFSVNTYNLIIMRTSFMGIPESLEESARIDGANDLHIFSKIIIPLSAPIIAVLVLYYGVYHWNSWFPALLYIRNRSRLPLQMILREILIFGTETQATSTGDITDMFSISETIRYTGIVIATAPILCVYPFLQKYFTKGVMLGAIKG